MELKNPIMCSCVLTSGSSSAHASQCWKAGWTTPGSWSLLNPWPVCPSSNTAWNGCWRSWGRCSRSPCTAPREGAREQQWPHSPHSMQRKCSGGRSLLSACKDNDINASARLGLFSTFSLTWHLLLFLLLKRFCAVESDATASHMNIYMNIYGKSAS